MKKAIAHINKNDKSPQNLAEHLQNVAQLGEQFAAKAGLPLSGKVSGLLHDFGKYSNEFQAYIRSAAGLIEQDHDAYIDAVAAKGKIDHSTAGAQHVWRHYGRNTKSIPYAQFLALAIASHHSGLIDSLSSDGRQVFIERMCKDDALTHYDECLHKCDAAIKKTVEELLSPEVMEELHRCIFRLCNQVSSLLQSGYSAQDKEHNICSREVQRGLLARFLLSCLLDADRIDSAEFEDHEYKKLRERMLKRPWPKLVDKLESYIAGFKQKYPIDSLRCDISAACHKRAGDPKGLFTLTVPTGGGKTLASLRFALHHAKIHGDLDRVIYVIPYTSIIDQNAKVARDILESGEEAGSIVLEHHSNILPEDESWQNKLLTDNWEAPVVFTTMVQFLESLFGAGTRHARRMHNLARSVIIFDEIQTLPLHCMHLFCNALNFLLEICGSSAILCTATQPCLDQLPNPYLGQLILPPEREIMPEISGLFAALKRVDFFDHCDNPLQAEEIAALALEEMHQSGSCLVVCNTKYWAEKVYAECCKHWQGTRCYLSTNLCPAHRMEKLEALRKALDPKKSEPVLCVSTQLIECGVDVSFGSVIRFAAGLDSILQSAGRCNRHGGKTQGRVHIVTVNGEHLDKLPDIKEGRRVYLDVIRHGLKELLESRNYDLNNPEIIDTYFKHYFHRRKNIFAYATRCSGRDDTLLNILGANTFVCGDIAHPKMLRQSFALGAKEFKVIESFAQAVVVPYAEGIEIISDLSSSDLFNKQRELLRKAQRYSVNLFPGTYERLCKLGALHNIQGIGVLCLSPSYYSGEFGVVTEPKGFLDTYNF